MSNICSWRGKTSKGRTLLVGKNAAAPTVAPSEFASCTNSGRTRRFGYPPPLQTLAGGAYSAWCLDNDENIISIEPYDCSDTVSPNDPCDCINGACVPKATYNTPGKYANLAACKSGCAKDSACAGECIPSADIAALQQAANKAQANCCK
jgi:hypothetical protein